MKPRAGGLGTSDFGLGTELLDGIEEPELERKLTAERNNGRRGEKPRQAAGEKQDM